MIKGLKNTKWSEDDLTTLKKKYPIMGYDIRKADCLLTGNFFYDNRHKTNLGLERKYLKWLTWKNSRYN